MTTFIVRPADPGDHDNLLAEETLSVKAELR
jgi:hypothetical protein